MRNCLFILFVLCISFAASAQCINTFPYTADFENTDGGWTAHGTASDWIWGSPSKTAISQAANGNNCWITGGLTDSSYNGNQRSYLQSPCFDFTNVPYPEIAFNIFWDTENGNDGGNLEYSNNNGVSWHTIGTPSPARCSTDNWYNTSNITYLSGLSFQPWGWSGNNQDTSGSCQGGGGSNGWVKAKYCLNTGGQSNVMLRFTFAANGNCNNYDGLAIDDIEVTGMTPALDVNFNCIGDSVLFTASVNFCSHPIQWWWEDGSKDTATAVSHHFPSPGDYPIATIANSDHCASLAIFGIFTVPVINFSSYAATCTGLNDGKAVAIVDTLQGFPATYAWSTDPVQTTNTAINLTNGTYRVTVTSELGCGTASVEVNRIAQMDVSLSTIADTCWRSTGVITVSAPGSTAPYQYSWSNGSDTAALTNLNSANYSVTLSDANGCSGTATAFVPAVSGMEVQFTEIKNVSCNSSADGYIDATVAGGEAPYIFSWSGNHTGSYISQLNVGTYILTVTDVEGCAQIDTVVIEKSDCPSYVYFPNAFTPNNDGLNETFKPGYSDDLKKMAFRVYNRWGERVFESADATQGWNGLYKGQPQPVGTYVFMAEYYFADDVQHKAVGDITLLR